LPSQPNARSRQQQNEDRQHRRHAEGHRRARPEAQRKDRPLIGQDRVEPGRAAGAAVGHQIDQAKGIESIDRREQHRHGEHILEARQRDVAKALDRASAIDLGGLVELFVDRLQSRQQKDGVERDALPDIDRDHARHRQRGLGQPGHAPVDQPQRL
jgi:hypothetical protein